MAQPSPPAEPEAGAAARRERAIIAAAVVLHVALGLYFAAALNTWVDEEYTLHTTARGPLFAWRQAVQFELQPPAYFVLLSLWRLPSDSVIWARAFSLLCTTLALVEVVRLKQRALPEVPLAALALVLAVNPFLLWAATECRVYGLLILVTALLLRLLWDGYLADQPRLGARVAYVLASLLGLYTQYYLGLFLVGAFAGLIALRRWRAARDYLLSMAAVALGLVPLLPIIRAQVVQHTVTLQQPPALVDAVKQVLWRVQDYVIPLRALELPLVDTWLWRLLLLTLAVIAVWQAKRLATSLTLVFVAISGVLACAYFALMLRLGTELVDERHTAALLLPAVLTVVSLGALPRRRWLALSICGLLVGASIVTLAARGAQGSKLGDWRRAAAILHEHEQPREPILVFAPYAALGLERYYEGQNVVLPIPRPQSFEHYDVREYALESEAEIAAPLAEFAPDHERLWLVRTPESEFLGVDYHVQILDDFLARGYVIEEEHALHGVTISRWRRR